MTNITFHSNHLGQGIVDWHGIPRRMTDAEVEALQALLRVMAFPFRTRRLTPAEKRTALRFARTMIAQDRQKVLDASLEVMVY